MNPSATQRKVLSMNGFNFQQAKYLGIIAHIQKHFSYLQHYGVKKSSPAQETYQFSSQALLQVGQYSHRRPKLLGSVHSHFPHTHFPLPLQIWPFEFRQCFADCTEHWQRSPSQPAKHLHLPASHSPLPITQIVLSHMLMKKKTQKVHFYMHGFVLLVLYVKRPWVANQFFQLIVWAENTSMIRIYVAVYC